METYQRKNEQYHADIKPKFMRDPNNRKLAGVCSGLAKYFNLDVSIIRLVWFFLAFFGIFSAGISTFFVVLVYIILWMVTPKMTQTYHYETHKK